jgi:hypothetical protein
MARVGADGPWINSCPQAGGDSVIVGLNDDEVFSIARLAAELTGKWLVEYHEDYHGTASVLLVSEGEHDAALLFTRENGFLHLDVMLEDDSEHIASAHQIESLFPAAQSYSDAPGEASRSRGWHGRSGDSVT